MKTPSVAQADLLAYAMGDRSGPLSRLLSERALSPVFQPIASMADGAIYAHEALIRGPHGLPVHRPDALLAAARREGLLQDFEVACVVAALRRWAELGQTGRLFINFSATGLVRCFAGRGGERIAASVRAFGLQPSAIVFEITEHDHVADVQALVDVAHEVHDAGMSFALDDFGDGRSSLRLWSELAPDVVKVDKYFILDISRHARKLRTVRALMQIAETFGTLLVAEGVETGDDLRVLRDLGIAFAQGYFLGRPGAAPRSGIEPVAQQVIDDRRVSVMPVQRLAASPRRMSKVPVIPIDPLAPQASNDEVAEVFHAHAEWHAVALVDGGRPVGLIGRQQFLDRYAKPYFRELYGRKPALTFANTAPTLIEHDASIDELIAVLTSSDQRYLGEGYIGVANGLYRGLGTGHQLVRQVTESRIEAARHANPLTLLPGNIPISEHIDRLLAAGAEFVACYADLSHFKPFNDYYGYWRGDEVIKLLASVLAHHCDPRRDFLGHVGGDDFVVLFQSSDWERRCDAIAAEFDAAAVQLYDDEARAVGGIHAEDRHGVRRFFGYTSLYMGAVPVADGTRLRRAADVASAAARAKQAAKVGGHSVYVDAGVQPPLDSGLAPLAPAAAVSGPARAAVLSPGTGPDD